MNKRTKTLAVTVEGAKALGEGAEISAADREKINTFAHADIPDDQLYVRKIRLAHNAIDRDGERFSEKVLKDFAATLPGKGLLIGHRWGPPGEGLFFDAAIEKMNLEDAKALTGEDLRLPAGADQVQFLQTKFYTVRGDDNADLLRKVDAGIVRHASIGFSAANLDKVSDEESGKTLYHEYKAPGEALEGSLVWLGAQPGATTTKSAAIDKGADSSVHIDEDPDKQKAKETKPMKNLMKMLGLSENATEDEALHALHLKDCRLKSIEAIIEPLGDEPTAGQVKALLQESADGKAYRADLVESQIKAETLVGRLDDTPEASKTRKRELATRSVSEINADVKYLTGLAVEKFPSRTVIDGGQPGKERTSGDDTPRFRKTAGGEN